MKEFQFATPLAFLLLIPLAVAAWRLLRRSRNIRATPFAPTHRLPARTAGWRSLVARAVPFMFLAGLLSLVIAAARPRTFFARESHSSDAIAIAMVVDVSGSMEALDLTKGRLDARDAKTRLDVVKEVFAEFIAERPDDLVSLISFGGYASTRSPLTADHTALLHILKGVEIPGREERDNGRQISNEETMTAIGDGLTTACARLRSAEPKTKIIVLLSDGVSNAGIITPGAAAEIAAELGVRVYTIGVGSAGRAPYRVRDAFGREVLQYFSVEFNDQELRKIAEKTGGRYFNVRDNDAFRAAMADIDKLETTRVTRNVYRHYNERHTPFLIFGAFASCLAILLNTSILHRPL